MYAEERQQAMARAVAARGRMSVAELAGEYDVTTETVRRTSRHSKSWAWSAGCTGERCPRPH